MKKIIFLSLALFFGVHAAQAQTCPTVFEVEQGIVNGTLAKVGHAPYMTKITGIDAQVILLTIGKSDQLTEEQFQLIAKGDTIIRFSTVETPDDLLIFAKDNCVFGGVSINREQVEKILLFAAQQHT